MSSIPIVSLGNLVSTVVAIFAFVRLQRSYVDSGGRNQFVGSFMKFFGWFAVYLGLGVLPGIVLFDARYIAVIPVINNIFLYLAMYYFLSIPLEIWGYVRFKKILGIALMIYAAGLVIMGTLHVQPSQFVSVGRFYIFKPVLPSIIRNATGLPATAAALLGSLFFIVGGIRAQSNLTKRRSYIIGFGMAMLIFASLLNYFVFPLSYTFALIAYIYASLLASLALIVMYLGISVDITFEDQEGPVVSI